MGVWASGRDAPGCRKLDFGTVHNGRIRYREITGKAQDGTGFPDQKHFPIITGKKIGCSPVFSPDRKCPV